MSWRSSSRRHVIRLRVPRDRCNPQILIGTRVRVLFNYQITRLLNYQMMCASVNRTRDVIDSGLRFFDETAHLQEAVHHPRVTDVTRRHTSSLKPLAVGLSLVA